MTQMRLDQAPDTDLSDSNLLALHIDPKRRLCGLERLDQFNINKPTITGYSPFQMAIACRDMAAIARIVMDEHFDFTANLRTFCPPARTLTDLHQFTAPFLAPKPINEFEDDVLFQFLAEIERTYTTVSDSAELSETRIAFSQHVRALMLDRGLREQCRHRGIENAGTASAAFSSYDPMTKEWVSTDAMSLLDELYFQPGKQVPKNQRWIIAALEKTVSFSRAIMPPDAVAEPKANLDPKVLMIEAAKGARVDNFEMMLQAFLRLPEHELEAGMAILRKAGLEARKSAKDEAIADAVKAKDSSSRLTKSEEMVATQLQQLRKQPVQQFGILGSMLTQLQTITAAPTPKLQGNAKGVLDDARALIDTIKSSERKREKRSSVSLEP